MKYWKPEKALHEGNGNQLTLHIVLNCIRKKLLDTKKSVMMVPDQSPESMGER